MYALYTLAAVTKIILVIVMKLINFALKSAFVTGSLTTGAFITGLILGSLVKNDKVINKLKKMQIKKNTSASTK